ncbi:protein kinase [Nonomuraea pusilla]|uniref:serine/threonine-protein kinase n=1 Tax=Nonomuraea pusilla TaxID=46177 RepID=UPI003326E680
MSDLRTADPRQLGPYRLLRRLGQGGQGVVFLGCSPNGAQVAVKLLHAGLSGSSEARRRFLGEVEAVRRVAPFCTAQLLDADLEGDRPYLVSEYVEGPSLREHVAAKGPRLGGSLDRLAIGTATALGAIHRAGVVHRDFKPANVLLGLDGPRVIDFGVSRLVDTAATSGMIPVGTPAYLAPERIKGEPAGPAADLWAWALTVAYTANGRQAYAAETYQETLARILYGKPDLGVLSGTLREIVDACLAPEPGDRPGAEEVLRRLLGQEAGGDVLTSGARAAIAATSPDGIPATSPDGIPATRPDGVPAYRPDGIPATWPDAASAAGPENVTRHQQVDALSTAGPAALSTAGPTAGPTADAGPTVKPGPAAGGLRRRVRPWQAGLAAVVVALAAAGAALWPRDTPAPALDGVWTGAAEHPSAGRVFPLELRIADGGTSTMRWGSDLHCSARLHPAGDALTFTLAAVKGDQCHPGTLRLARTKSDNQLTLTVSRDGDDRPAYSGKVSRTP